MNNRQKKIMGYLVLALLLGGITTQSSEAFADDNWNCEGTINSTHFACYGESSSTCTISGEGINVKCKGTRMVVKTGTIID